MLQSQLTAHHTQYSLEVDLWSTELSSRHYPSRYTCYQRKEEEVKKKDGSCIWRPVRGSRDGPRVRGARDGPRTSTEVTLGDQNPEHKAVQEQKKKKQKLATSMWGTKESSNIHGSTILETRTWDTRRPKKIQCRKWKPPSWGSKKIRGSK
jgi:hypothetical protein